MIPEKHVFFLKEGKGMTRNNDELLVDETKKVMLLELEASTSSSGNSTTGWGEGVRGEGGAISTGLGSVTRGLKIAP